MAGLTAEIAACHELCQLVERRIGIHIRPEQHRALAQFIEQRTQALGLDSAAAYCPRLAAEAVHGDEFTRLVTILSNPHTYFFRDVQQLAVLPHLGQVARASGRPLAVWSAGCATGEEPYTLAIYCCARSIPVSILGTDLNPEALAVARTARYRDWALRRLTDSERARFLVRDGALYLVAENVRRSVELRQHNLVGDSPPSPPPPTGGWDVILCRNVFVYFDRPTVEQVVRSFATVLAPGGLLVTGVAESLYALDVPFELVEIAGTLAYRPGAPQLRLIDTFGAAVGATSPLASAGVPEISSLDEPPLTSALAAPAAPAFTERAAATDPYTAATVLIGRGDFAAAEEGLCRVVEADPGHLPARLTLAGMYLRRHVFDAATALCQEALAQAPLLAETHYLLGVVYRKVGDLEQAASALQKALFLEPHLWCASFLLAGVHRRLGRTLDCQRNLLHTLSELDDASDGPAFISCTAGMPDVDLAPEEVRAVCRRQLVALGRPID